MLLSKLKSQPLINTQSRPLVAAPPSLVTMPSWSIWEDQVISAHVKQYHKAYTVKQMAQELANANVFKGRTLAEIEQRIWVWVEEGMLF